MDNNHPVSDQRPTKSYFVLTVSLRTINKDGNAHISRISWNCVHTIWERETTANNHPVRANKVILLGIIGETE